MQTGAKISAIVFATIAVFFCYWLIVRYEIRYRLIWLIALLAAGGGRLVACEGLDCPIEEDDRLAGGDFDPLELAAGRGEVMLVGHEPDFSSAVALVTGSRVKFKKGGIAALDDHLLHVLMRPNELKAIAGR